ncbi:G5 domain-containing protein [Asanoa sp. NPDC050611]|uniref:G5 domain-containing protein n=1 Tax=Asanoa sp. NPDC050611 TaxID=3157098 RepID=UPI0033F02B0A
MPTIEKRTVTETKAIPYSTKRVNDSSLAKGTTRVSTRGVAGVKTLTYEVTLTNGTQTGKKLVRTVITKQPVTQVTRVGTKVAQKCDPNYSGACVPIASDVDCAGGSGNGPAYVRGPVQVIGSDIYDLDRDGDGTACD